MSTPEIIVELIMSLPEKDQKMIHDSLMMETNKEWKGGKDFDSDPMVDELDALYAKAWL